MTEPAPARLLICDEDDFDCVWDVKVAPEETAEEERAVRFYIKPPRRKEITFVIEQDEGDVDQLAEIFAWLAGTEDEEEEES